MKIYRTLMYTSETTTKFVERENEGVSQLVFEMFGVLVLLFCVLVCSRFHITRMYRNFNIIYTK